MNSVTIIYLSINMSSPLWEGGSIHFFHLCRKQERETKKSFREKSLWKIQKAIRPPTTRQRAESTPSNATPSPSNATPSTPHRHRQRRTGTVIAEPAMTNQTSSPTAPSPTTRASSPTTPSPTNQTSSPTTPSLTTRASSPTTLSPTNWASFPTTNQKSILDDELRVYPRRRTKSLFPTTPLRRRPHELSSQKSYDELRMVWSLLGEYVGSLLTRCSHKHKTIFYLFAIARYNFIKQDSRSSVSYIGYLNPYLTIYHICWPYRIWASADPRVHIRHSYSSDFFKRTHACTLRYLNCLAKVIEDPYSLVSNCQLDLYVQMKIVKKTIVGLSKLPIQNYWRPIFTR